MPACRILDIRKENKATRNSAKGKFTTLFDQYITKVQFEKRPDHSINTRTVNS